MYIQRESFSTMSLVPSNMFNEKFLLLWADSPNRSIKRGKCSIFQLWLIEWKDINYRLKSKLMYVNMYTNAMHIKWIAVMLKIVCDMLWGERTAYYKTISWEWVCEVRKEFMFVNPQTFYLTAPISAINRLDLRLNWERMRMWHTRRERMILISNTFILRTLIPTVQCTSALHIHSDIHTLSHR